MEVKQNNIFPFKIEDLDDETNASFIAQFEDEFDGFIRVGPKRYFMPKIYEKYAPGFYNMNLRADHVFVGGYPRSGTTWTQQLVWLIMNDLDYATCEATLMEEKFLYLEALATVHPNTLKRYAENTLNDAKQSELLKICHPPLELVTQCSYIKTHLPLSLLPPNLLEISKMVYVARDPRDMMVSFYYLTKGGYWAYGKEFKDMFRNIIDGNMFFCPYFEHVKESWEQRHNPNMLFLFYEDILHNQLTTLRRVADFFKKSYSDEQLSGLADYLHISNLKDKKSFNNASLKELGMLKQESQPFIRKGKSGGWRQHFDEGMCREAEQWIADSLRGTDLRFPSVTRSNGHDCK